MGDPRTYPKPSKFFSGGGTLAFAGSLLVIIAFASPYWLESYSNTHSEFVRLGLWEACFRDYRHPPYQYDEKFNGCHWYYSYKFQNIRDWLQPGWFMFVQAMMTLAVILLLLSLALISLVLMRYWIKYEVYILAGISALELIITGMIFLAVCVFGGMCFERSWLQYPMFNHLSWSFAFAVMAFILHGSASLCFLKEIFKAKERVRRMNTLVYNMQPRF
ncbi:pck [Cordylochernes scorpioides]|uniref:Pck n=1 Tax=Cordylochernes scorpioides TaxID=51811 RepID=A0ABY6LGN1_9ARAC|nr:pck [Cordylochernes scorpioides]